MSKVRYLEELNGIGGVLAHGTFDLLHIGHLRYFKEAAKYGVLTVTMTAGVYIENHGPGRPVFTDEERIEMIDALEVVDYCAIVYEPTGEAAIRAVCPQFYCKGAETRREGNKQLEREMNLVKYYGGEVIFIPKTLPYSSGKLLSGEMLK